MPNRSADALFQLVQSLQKAEKRNFKLYVTRNSSGEDMKIIQLFDALDKMTDYDEELLFKKYPTIKKQQLSNLKAHLYKQILASIRLLESEQNIDIQLHEQLDYARILYNKCLFHQSLKMLDKIKEKAKAHNQISFLIQVLFLEKKIEALHITRSMQDRADELTNTSNEVMHRLARVTRLSNLALQLYSWYIKNGHARNAADEKMLSDFFHENIPADRTEIKTFYSRLYLYQSYCWYAFIRQDFLMYYRYCQKWVDLFEAEPFMISIETGHYIKGMHNLVSAHFDLSNYKKFEETLARFELFAQSDVVKLSDNNKVQTFVYVYIAKINRHFLHGTFAEGILLVPYINDKLEAYSLYLDRHRVLVFYYKIASLYFGAGDYGRTIDYLMKIINLKVDLRTDLQCYARLLHLIAHYELGNFDILEHLILSVYRFMAKMQNLSGVEEEIFKFIRRSFRLSAKQLKPEFEKLLDKLKAFEKNRLEARAFSYLDIISWLESKLSNVPVEIIIQNKFRLLIEADKRKGNNSSPRLSDTE